MLGFYFDTFLKENYFKQSKDKISHAISRVASDFRHAESELIQGIEFIEKDIALIASMDLINNYQDKNDYNTVLLDEEKKEITKYLLEKIKASFNASIKLYDKNAELVAYVYKNEDRHVLNFVSYEDAKKVLYSKYESEFEYKKNQYLDKQINLPNHISYYTQPELKSGVVVTYHNIDDAIQIVSHYSIFDKENPLETTMHIEMSKNFGKAYLKNVSNDLDLEVSISNEKKYENMSVALFGNTPFKDENIFDETNNYMSAFSIKTKDNNVYLVFNLDKETLNDMLNQNRLQLIVFLSVSIIVIIILFNLLIHMRISTPLAKLMGQISKIKNGDYSSSEIVKTADELEVVSENINNLATSLLNREVSLKASQNQLEYLSTHDELTGLLNRRSFSIQLEYALQKANRNKTKLAVLFLDLDEFK